MQRVNIVLLCLALSGCYRQGLQENVSDVPKWRHDGLDRYENDEVICYLSYKVGMQCKWKEKQE